MLTVLQHSRFLGQTSFQILAGFPKGLRKHLFKWDQLIHTVLLKPRLHPPPLAGM